VTLWRVLGIPVVAVTAVLSGLCALFAVFAIPSWRGDPFTFYTVMWPVVLAAASFGFGVIAVWTWRAPEKLASR
jgi:hypothetical protein